MLKKITPIVITFNEQANIERTLSGLSWAKEVLILDSFSSDETLAICRRFSNVRIVQRHFDDFAGQCNFALQQDIKTEWVMSMDADYVLTAELVNEINELGESPSADGYQIDFDYLINGRSLKGSLYPARIVLYKKQLATYLQDGHAHKVAINGSLDRLVARIQHDDRKPFGRWLNSQKNYARQEATKLSQISWSQLSWPDRSRALGIAPLLVVPYSLLIKGLLFSGWPGFIYTGQRFIAELYLQLARLKLL